MIAINRFADRLFNEKNITDERLGNFVDDFLKRASINNKEGMYDELLLETKLKYEVYFGTITSEDTNFALQQSYTKMVDRELDKFKNLLRRRSGLVISEWGKESPEYQEFFPLGITEYTSMGKNNAEKLMTRILNAFKNHSAIFGNTVVTEFTDALNKYTATRDNQLGKKGEVSGDKQQTADNRIALEMQMQYNVLTIARNNIGKPENMKLYFTEGLLFASGRGVKKDEEDAILDMDSLENDTDDSAIQPTNDETEN
jgi:hypothetical protein